MTASQEMYSTMQKQATEISTDTIIQGEIDKPSEGARIASQAILVIQDVFTRLESKGQAVAIQFIEKRAK